MSLVTGLLFVTSAPLVGGLLSGIDRKLTARAQGRIGPPVIQPLYDTLKLLRKTPIVLNRIQVVYATLRSLIVLDEIGRGTSTFDGLALASAIASQLHDRNRAFTLFATHYFELTEFPARHERAINVHVSAAESHAGKGEQIVFLHQIEAGPASRSYGVQVARLAGMPAALLRQARTTLEALEAKARSGDAQVDLFAAPAADAMPESAEPPAPPSHEAAVCAALAGIDPDTLSPREALDALYRLKHLQKESP